MNKIRSLIPFIYWALFIIWSIHLYIYLPYDKFAFANDGVYFTDEGYWNFPARYKYLFDTWTDPECHYNHRIYITPLYQFIQYNTIKIFGLNITALRLPSLLFFILTFLILTYYILKIRKQPYTVALIIMLPFFIERYLLTRFTAALLESLLVFLTTSAFVLYKLYLYKEKNYLLILSFFLLLAAFFVKSYVILLAIPFIMMLDFPLSKKILIGLAVFCIPILWNLHLRYYHPHAFRAIYYDLFSFPRIQHPFKTLTGLGFIEIHFIFINPLFWFIIYYLLFKTSSYSLFKKDIILVFDMVLVLYLTTVLIMANLMRYSLPLIPAYVDMVIYLVNKRFTLSKKWIVYTLIIYMFYIILYISIVSFHNNPLTLKFLVLITVLVFLLTLVKIGAKIGESIFITLTIGGIIWRLDTLSYFNFLGPLYLLLPHVLLFLVKENKNSNKGFPLPVLVLILYLLISPLWLPNEIGYFKGKNRFRRKILQCVSQRVNIPDIVGGRAVDNYMLYTPVRTLGLLGPDYDIVYQKRDIAFQPYKINANCVEGKNVLIFGYPYNYEKDSILNTYYINRIIEALPIKPLKIDKIGICKFIFDNDTTNFKATKNVPIYIFSF